jgi:excisionase family DNA binding protein
MARTKKVTFDNMPGVLGQIYDLLFSGNSEFSAQADIVNRLSQIERVLSDIKWALYPSQNTMDKTTVCRILKMKPTAVTELEKTGDLPPHFVDGKKVFYEIDVMRLHYTSGWKSVVDEAMKSAPTAVPVNEPTLEDESPLIDIDAVAKMIGRTKGTIYTLVSKNKIPFIKERGKLLFDSRLLKEWMASKSRRNARSQKETVESSPLDSAERVDIYGASQILGRSPGAIRQHLSTLPHTKVGNKLFFDPKKLTEWAETHTPRKRKSKHDIYPNEEPLSVR